MEPIGLVIGLGMGTAVALVGSLMLLIESYSWNYTLNSSPFGGPSSSLGALQAAHLRDRG